MSFAVEVYDGTNPAAGGSLLRTFTDDSDRSLRLPKNDAGTWTVQVPRDSTDAGFVQTHRWVKFRLDGDVIASGRIGPWEQDTVAQGEEAAENLTISGPGLLATLRDAIVFPHLSTGRLARDTRTFNFASPEFDYSAWGAAIELYQQGDPATSLYGIDAPENWPNPNAWWMWGTALDLLSSPPHDVGDCYFRTMVNLPSEGDYSFFITADDGYELWVDGVLLAAQTEAFIWRQTFRIDQFLDAGDHEIGIKGTNINRPNTPVSNAAGVLFSLYSTLSGGELGVLYLQSDSTWNCEPYPAQPPGFTAGDILDILLQEAFDRGAIQVWSWSFSAALDSNGNAWADEITIAFRYDDKLYDVLGKLAETYIDFTADPDLIELDAVNKGGLGTATGISLLQGTHLGSLRHSNDPSRVTDLLMQDADSVLTEVSSGIADDPPDGDNPRIEDFLAAGSAPNTEAATAMAQGVFDSAGAYRVAVAAAVEAVAGAAPIVDFQVGDSVLLPNKAGAATATEVTAIVVTDISPEADGELEGSVGYAIEGFQDAA